MTWCLFSMRYYYPVYKKDKVNCTLDRPMLNILLYVIVDVLSDGDVILRILWMYKYHSTLHTWEKFPVFSHEDRKYIVLMFTTGIYQLILLTWSLCTQSKIVYSLLIATAIFLSNHLFFCHLDPIYHYCQKSNSTRTYSLCSVSGKSRTQCSSSITFCFSSSDFSFSICRALLCMNWK